MRCEILTTLKGTLNRGVCQVWQKGAILEAPFPAPVQEELDLKRIVPVVRMLPELVAPQAAAPAEVEPEKKAPPTEPEEYTEERLRNMKKEELVDALEPLKVEGVADMLKPELLDIALEQLLPEE